MSAERVLIVGAGALGLTTAYHLQLAGAEVSLLVRAHRESALQRAPTLYSYDENAVHTLANYRLFTAEEQLRGESFDFVLLTLDGATCTSEQGTMTLSALGEILRHDSAVMLICGVGPGLLDHVRRSTGLPGERLLEGTMKMFAYQTSAPDAPRPAPASKSLHDSADVAYLNFPDRVGFYVTTAPKAASRDFVALYNKSGKATCKTIPTRLYRMTTSTFSCTTVASELKGWEGTEALLGDSALWGLCCESQREILRLKRNGFPGKALAWMFSDRRIAARMRKTEAEAAPMGFTAFNRCHHGGKVLAQNVGILERCVAEGEASGQAMPATRELLSRWRELH